MTPAIGQKWRSTPSFNAWEITAFKEVKGKPCVELSRNGVSKTIQTKHLLTSYILVGSAEEARSIDDWNRSKWPLAPDIQS